MLPLCPRCLQQSAGLFEHACHDVVIGGYKCRKQMRHLADTSPLVHGRATQSGGVPPAARHHPDATTKRRSPRSASLRPPRMIVSKGVSRSRNSCCCSGARRSNVHFLGRINPGLQVSSTVMFSRGSCEGFCNDTFFNTGTPFCEDAKIPLSLRQKAPVRDSPAHLFQTCQMTFSSNLTLKAPSPVRHTNIDSYTYHNAKKNY